MPNNRIFKMGSLMGLKALPIHLSMILLNFGLLMITHHIKQQGLRQNGFAFYALPVIRTICTGGGG